MKALEEKIIREGIVKKGNILKVDSFLKMCIRDSHKTWIQL